MKAYVSIDMEGLPGVFHPAQTYHKGFLYEEAKRIMTHLTVVVAKELISEGFDEVWIADAHWFMGNIVYDMLPDRVFLVRGMLRPLFMVPCIDRGFDALLLIGYHAAGGTEAVLSHTLSDRIFAEVTINGRRISEFYLNGMIASSFNVPIILVAGDDKLKEEVLNLAPWVEYVVTKESISLMSAIMKPIDLVIMELRSSIRKAVQNLKAGRCKLIPVPKNLCIEIRFRRAHYADIACLLPEVKRVDAYTVRIRRRSIVDIYNIMQLLALAAMGFDSTIETLIK